MAYDAIDPIGRDRDDLNAGIVAAAIANAFRGKKGRRVKPSDFMPRWAEQTQEEQVGVAQKIVKFFKKSTGPAA